MSRCPWSRVFLATSVVVFILTASTGVAEAGEAKDLLDKAVELFSSGDFDGSLSLLEQARQAPADLRLLGRIHLQRGVVLEVLKREREADEAFREALICDPSLDLDPEQHKGSTVNRFRMIKSRMVGDLRVTAEGRKAMVFVDGKVVGRAPCTTRLPVGEHSVRVQSEDGLYRYKGKAVVEPKRITRLNATMTQIPLPPPRRILTWLAAAGAAVSLGVAIGLGVWADQAYDEHQTTWDVSRWRESREETKTRALGANIMFGVGGTLAAASVGLFFLEGHWHRERQLERFRSSGKARARLVPLLGEAAGVQLRAEF